MLGSELAGADSALDIDTGGGEVVAEALNEAADLPSRMVATEAWPPHVLRARDRLGPCGGVVVEDLRTARLRMEFFDIGAIVWILRKCVWWVPDFTVERHAATLRRLDAQLRSGLPVVAHSSRHLVVARRP